MTLIRVIAELELPADPRENASATLEALDLIEPFLDAMRKLGGNGEHKTVRERKSKISAPVLATAAE